MDENNKPKSRWQRWRQNLKHNYRLVVMNNETFEEVGAYQLTLLNVYLVVTSLLVIFTLLVGSVFAFTPLRKYIPGYGDTVQVEELRDLQREVRELEKQLAVHRDYTENFRRILVGDAITAEDAESDVTQVDTSNVAPVPLSEEEIRLRREMELEQVGRTVRGGSALPRAGSTEIPLEQHYFVAPVTGEISAAFDAENDHNGVDILAPKNTPIKALMDGTVFLADWTQETGYTLGIQHSNNIITFYKHNSELLKSVGSTVNAGEAVAIIGNTGQLTTGPHLHFELWYRGKPVNPVDYISF